MYIPLARTRGRPLVYPLLAAIALAAGPALAADDPAVVAWLRDGRVETRVLSATGPARADASALPATVPLGSLWKLFVFAYLSERQIAEPAYVCRPGERNGEDRYCCMPGESVGRNEALARSCAPYFDPVRLQIAAADWRTHWRNGGRTAPAWLARIEKLGPATQVPPRELLGALAALPAATRDDARRALLDVAFTGYGREAWTALGTGARYKTYTWHRAESPTISFGGAAGWLADGTPFWFGARGSSRTALAAWGPALAAALPAPRWLAAAAASGDPSCVDVDFFARYPLRAVWHEGEDRTAGPGVLTGRYRIEFENGNWLRVAGGGRLRLDAGPRPTIAARLTVNEYVARVIDREGGAAQPDAARALAVASRTYLVQNAAFEGGCWRIEDSSRTQRVSPNPPSDGALAAAWFTDELVLQNVSVRYHRDASGANRLAWRDAVAQANEGWSFERILGIAYPRATLATLSGREDCARMDAAEEWLGRSVGQWARRLRAEAGYEAVTEPLRVCSLAEGRPYADQARLRIYVRGWRSLDERVALAHEYLHLAFRRHPRGADEAYIERLARQLIEGGA